MLIKKSFSSTMLISLAALILLIQIYPIVYVFLGSLKTAQEFQTSLPYELPMSINLENYKKVFTTSHMMTYFKNSIFIVVVQIFFLLFISSMAGFALSKIQFRGKFLLMSYFLLGLMLPFQVALIPLFFIFNKLKMLNTYSAVIIPQLAFSLSYSIHLFYSFYKFLPNEMIEASIIDGCSPLVAYMKIVIPMSKNAFLTIATMQGVFCWNEFICAYTFTRSTAMKTITLGLNDFVGMYGLTDWGATFSAIIITVLPTLIFYFLTGKYMLTGLTAGAVKG